MSNAQSLIEQFYQEEQELKAQEATFTPLDLSVSSADMAMINIISKRFNKDKQVLVREALSQALIDMFNALEPVERKMLSKEADEMANSIAQEIAEEQGLDQLEVTGTNWAQQDKQAAKDEKKAEKIAQQEREKLEAEIRAEIEAEQADINRDETAEAANEAEAHTEESHEALSETAGESEPQENSIFGESQEEEKETSSNSIFA
ncbi:hypothetical protein HF888_06700 [Bermanella marisrubri]|uniref:Uncharacterized protein n=1 Tax=Bermanella marisrubri TaxID=207949 RepID=Q1N5C3_9GAMM|nr:hypothetical protein [Bermanella marisrubri]EAT13160.1 hypothetical protein RED65_00330 [Oceanobacter sp. RED65] [Bermanella marisrubri]QIZ83934.1 hypothetical protein HF888_06700 [Bermanella marisrubri]